MVTRWRDEESFKAWLTSPSFGHGHQSAAERSGGEQPKPQGLRRLVETTGTPPSRTVLVGDSAADLQAAGSAGTAFVLVQRYALVGAAKVLACGQGSAVHLVHDLDLRGRPVCIPAREAV